MADERSKVYVRYKQNVLTEVGIDTAHHPEIPGKVVARMQALSAGTRLVLFDDVVPAMKTG